MVRETPLHGGHPQIHGGIGPIWAPSFAPPVSRLLCEAEIDRRRWWITRGTDAGLVRDRCGYRSPVGEDQDLRPARSKAEAAFSHACAAAFTGGRGCWSWREWIVSTLAAIQDYFDGSREAQRWSTGLELVLCLQQVGRRPSVFERRLDFDPECVMAHWASPMAAGLSTNMTWRDHSEEEADTATASPMSISRSRAPWRNRRTELEKSAGRDAGLPRSSPHSVPAGRVRSLGR